MSPILLATNSKTGIFGIFPKAERKYVTFKTGILGVPAIKVTTKVNLKAMTIEFCAVAKMSQFHRLSGNNGVFAYK